MPDKSVAGWRSAVPEPAPLDEQARRVDAWVACLAAACVGLCYLGGAYVWDDVPLIAQRLALLDVSGILSLWTGSVTETGPGSAYYRPVSMTVLAGLGRLGPLPIHLLALSLHAASTYVLVRLCSGLRSPLLAGVVFAVHPLVGEVLGWSSALPDALAVFLGLLSVYLGRRTPLLGFVLLVLGFWSKETAVVVAALVVAGLGGTRRLWLPWLAAVVVGLSGRILAGVGGAPVGEKNLGLIPDAMGWALGGMIWPLPLHVIRDVLVAPDSIVMLGWVLIVVLGVLARRSRAAWAGFALMVAAHAVAMPVVLDGYLLGVRYSYPALVGFSLWLAAVVSWRPRFWVVLAALSAAMLLHGNDRERWTSNLALFDHVEEAAHNSGLAWHLYAMSNLEASQYREAGLAFERVLASNKPFPGDETLALVAWVSAGEHMRALAAAESGPQDGLTAAHLAWWARAAWGAGDKAQARSLLSKLKGPDGYDGPHWVTAFADTVFGEGSSP